MKPCKMLADCPEVLSAIDGELSYINSLTSIGRADANDYGVQGQLVTLERYTRKAIDAWTDNAGEQQSLDQLRKCAAIAIKALIQYGCPRRQ